ncbi:unnamed protein product [Clonostachys rosea]|uniref:Major facilitator superfamily (MFS) profile domain-containing protein n=1 Tax=Bionectria ochroleuca TaxID=29856 RepID=A0ABY6V0N6_BIOOC|nr:unnamed protein product [Clonostachys rosea]
MTAKISSNAPAEVKNALWIFFETGKGQILVMSHIMQYLDEVSWSYAAVYELRTDLKLTGLEYPWANSIFYFGYLVGEFPSNFLLQRFPIGKFIGVNILIANHTEGL